MSFSAKAVLNPASMATNACLISSPSLFTGSKVSYKPIKFQAASSCKNISSLSLHSFFSLTRKLRLSVVSAQEEGNNPVILEEKEEEEVEGGFKWGANVVGEAAGEGYAQPPEGAKVYVGNLPYDVDSEKLAQLFEPAGVVEIAEVIYSRDTEQSRGFGFVTMSTEEEAEKAVEMFSRFDMGGRLLTVNIAAPKGSRIERPPPSFEPTHKIYVGNLSWNVDDSSLEELFSQHGKVVSARVISDRETGRSRGFGFVVMSSASEMNDAIANLDGESLDGRAIKVNAASEDRPRRSRF
ncbi:hypothetical protein ABFS82_04G174600 [Erythranthe guttata]|uniref:RRM domain-containing protein n=1 Tax=Erythranthe guttata TaxID=4155 RepID=A0A022PSE8_ERYGU|nr:PREDICTED: 28 kDa ribonucleoprotein, chloroplastic-like [Erythranthe guttata]EYU17743.1 hypothetical protein MIMGU_mgv1a011024mg [Erythranthe guttata]|eukprot:XP_012829310.1 PREDICTED: 28 kDa ribonucleoprotein, chloroplastic-like [Erythranthe guttata]